MLVDGALMMHELGNVGVMIMITTRWGHTGLRWWGAPAGVRWDRTTETDPTVP